MEQRGTGNGQPQLTNGHQRSVGNGQQQQGMEGRQLGQRMGSHQLGNGMGHQRSTNGMQQPGHQPQHGIKAQNGVGRSQGHGFIVANQQQNTGLDPRRQQHPPQSSTPLVRPSPSTTLKTLMVPHACRQQSPGPSGYSLDIPNHHNKAHFMARCTTPTLDTNEGPGASAVSSMHKFVAGSFLKSGGRKCRRRG